MPTYNSRGFPLYSSDESFPGWAAAFNSQSNLLATALDVSDEAVQDGQAVLTIAALPVVGNWLGRLIYCDEDKMLRFWDGTGWITYGGQTPYFSGTGSGSIPSGSDEEFIDTDNLSRGFGFSAGVITAIVPGVYAVREQVNWDTLNLAGQRNLGIASTGDILGPDHASNAPPTIAFLSQDFATTVILNTGDTVTPYVAQNSGSSLSITASMSIHWVASI